MRTWERYEVLSRECEVCFILFFWIEIKLIVSRLLMKRRREHGECDTTEGGRGCLVFDTKVCTFRKPELGYMERIKKRFGVDTLCWSLATLIGIISALFWMQLASRSVKIGE